MFISTTNPKTPAHISAVLLRIHRSLCYELQSNMTASFMADQKMTGQIPLNGNVPSTTRKTVIGDEESKR